VRCGGRILGPQLIGSVIGTLEGILPEAAARISSFLAYNEARRWSKHKEEFGHGSPEGIAAPEAANNTVACTALIPMLSLGIPSSNSSAVLLGGFLMHGLIPGPMLLDSHSNIVYGLFAGLFVANIAMVIVGYVIMTPCIWLVSRPSRTSWRSSMRWWCRVSTRLKPASSRSASRSRSVCSATRCAPGALRFCRWCLVSYSGFMVESNYRRSLVLSDRRSHDVPSRSGVRPSF
jgi:putative tricarboxylic transport membrane protein